MSDKYASKIRKKQKIRLPKLKEYLFRRPPASHKIRINSEMKPKMNPNIRFSFNYFVVLSIHYSSQLCHVDKKGSKNMK
jgi:hypothetical protein